MGYVLCVTKPKRHSWFLKLEVESVPVMLWLIIWCGGSLCEVLGERMQEKSRFQDYLREQCVYAVVCSMCVRIYGVGFFDGGCRVRLYDTWSAKLASFLFSSLRFCCCFSLSRVFNWPARSKRWWPWFVLGFLWQLCVRWANVTLYFFVCGDFQNMWHVGVGGCFVFMVEEAGKEANWFYLQITLLEEKAKTCNSLFSADLAPLFNFV